MPDVTESLWREDPDSHQLAYRRLHNAMLESNFNLISQTEQIGTWWLARVVHHVRLILPNQGAQRHVVFGLIIDQPGVILGARRWHGQTSDLDLQCVGMPGRSCLAVQKDCLAEAAGNGGRWGEPPKQYNGAHNEAEHDDRGNDVSRAATRQPTAT
jgi:hypothetical protein